MVIHALCIHYVHDASNLNSGCTQICESSTCAFRGGTGKNLGWGLGRGKVTFPGMILALFPVKISILVDPEKVSVVSFKWKAKKKGLSFFQSRPLHSSFSSIPFSSFSIFPHFPSTGILYPGQSTLTPGHYFSCSHAMHVKSPAWMRNIPPSM